MIYNPSISESELMSGNLSRRPPVDIDAIMERIREEVRAQEQGRADPHPHQAPSGSGSIRCRDLLRFEDEEFLQQAYRALLHRMPEAEGLEFWLHKLRQLGWSKVEIIWDIRSSREGQVHGVPIRGLKPRYVLRKTLDTAASLPVLGWILRWCWSLARLPRLAMTVARLERGSRAAATEQEKLLSLQEGMTSLLQRIAALEKRIAALDGRKRLKRGKEDREKMPHGPPEPPAQT